MNDKSQSNQDLIISRMAYERPPLNVEYDFVAVIDCLSVQERQQYQIAEGLFSIFKKHSILSCRFNCASVQAVNESLRRLKTQASKTCFPIHFIGHGNTDGIAAGNSMKSWTDLSKDLIEVNSAMQGNLLINMTTCFGIHGIKMNEGHDYPFYGILGVNRKLHAGESQDAQKINAHVYKKWIRGMTINEIIRSTNRDMGEDILRGITSEGYRLVRELSHGEIGIEPTR